MALAVLSLLSAVAEERPLLCIVDDAQWLDAASSHALAFVARRLLADSVAIVFAVRDPHIRPEFKGLPDVTVGGLDGKSGEALLARAIPGRLDDRVRQRIVAETRGNPLALLELPRGMTAVELSGGFELPAAADLSDRLEDRYLQRVRELPEATQQLLLLAAAEPVGDATLLWRAAATLSIAITALTPAAEAQLLEIGARVRFRHPLVRSAVYRAAPLGDRRRAHEALAEVSDPEVDPDRRAWHRALAAAEPDESVAAELEHSAGRAQMRGGIAAAAAFLERAAGFDGRSSPPGTAGACSRTGQASGRCTGSSARSVGQRTGGTARPAPARPGGPHASADRVHVQPRQGRSSAPAGCRQAARVAQRAARTRDVS